MWTNLQYLAYLPLIIIAVVKYSIEKIIFRLVLKTVCTLNVLKKSQGKISTESVTRPVIVANDFTANLYM